jgi:taurine--2-oxoglutarate transaminase
VRWSNVFCNPPLIINEKEIKEGFAIIDKALKIVDEAME